MHKSLSTLFLCIGVFLCASSCHKDYSFEKAPVSHGSLKYNSGNCIPQHLSSGLILGKAISDSDIFQLKVWVKQPGTYQISSDTVNGYSFKSLGSFSDTGIITINVIGKGKPLLAGINTFHFSYDSSVCELTVEVAINSSSIPGNFTLLGEPNNCINYFLQGDYVVGVPLTDTNTLTLKVNVLAIGDYNVSTSTVNGYSFSGIGKFSATGPSTIVLKGFGTPLNYEQDQLTVNGKFSVCKISVNIFKPVSVNGTDHFPLSLGSYWIYNDILNLPDSISRTLNSNSALSNINYSNIVESYKNKIQVFYNCRKKGNDYFELCNVEKYTESVKFSPEIDAEILFLKEGLSTGDTWQSNEFSQSFGVNNKIYLQYFFKCLDANAIVNIYDNTFINVYKIEMVSKKHDQSSNIYTSTGSRYDFYYAEGIGLIYTRTQFANTSPSATQIRNWQVN